MRGRGAECAGELREIVAVCRSQASKVIVLGAPETRKCDGKHFNVMAKRVCDGVPGVVFVNTRNFPVSHYDDYHWERSETLNRRVKDVVDLLL